MKRVKIGDRFGRLSVVKELKERSKDGHVVYECKCDCGNTVKVRSKELQERLTKQIEIR